MSFCGHKFSFDTYSAICSYSINRHRTELVAFLVAVFVYLSVYVHSGNEFYTCHSYSIYAGYVIYLRNYSYLVDVPHSYNVRSDYHGKCVFSDGIEM